MLVFNFKMLQTNKVESVENIVDDVNLRPNPGDYLIRPAFNSRTSAAKYLSIISLDTLPTKQNCATNTNLLEVLSSAKQRTCVFFCCFVGDRTN